MNYLFPQSFCLLNFFIFNIFTVGGYLFANKVDQVEVSARFLVGADFLRSPRVKARSGDVCSIAVGRELSEPDNPNIDFEGTYLSLTPIIVDHKVILQGFGFVGAGKIDGADGIFLKAKKILSEFNAKQFITQQNQSSFADELEMRGMFKLGGVPYISLYSKLGGSFWLKKGEQKNGIELVQYYFNYHIPHVILKKGTELARVNFSSKSIEPMRFSKNITGGGTVFSLEAKSGEIVTLKVLGANGKVVSCSFTAEIL